jgi:hypothetical protein
MVGRHQFRRELLTLAKGYSRYHPDPVAAIEEDKRKHDA